MIKVRLLREARIRHAAGEIVTVTPAERDFLVSTDSAVVVDDAEKTKDTPAPKPKKTTRAAKK